MAGIVDLFLVYSFVKRLATPFNKWKAFDLGIIDAEGVVLRKRRTLTLTAEREAFGIYDVMILNMKKMLAKIPGGSTKLASYAAALFLIKEWNHFTEGTLLTENVTENELEESMLQFKRYILEDVAVNSISAGGVVGLDKEPVFSKKAQKRYTDGAGPLKRFKTLIAEVAYDTEDPATAFIKKRKNIKHTRPLEPATIPLT